MNEQITQLEQLCQDYPHQREVITNIANAALAKAEKEPRLRLEGIESEEPGCDVCAGVYMVPDSDGRYEACPSCLERREEDRIARAQADAGMPEAHLTSRFSTFHPGSAQAREALELARHYVSRSDVVERKGLGLYFYGPPGVGKSHLAYSILSGWLSAGRKAFAVREVDLLNRLSDRYAADVDRADAAENMFRTAHTAPLLVYDDLGSANPTPARREARYSIFEDRLQKEEQLPTIISSNHHPDQLLRTLGEATVSRIHGLCVTVPVTGPDHRRPVDGSRR